MVPYSINLTVSVDKVDKIFSFVNIIFAVSLHYFLSNLLIIYGTGDYEMVHSCGSSEVPHSSCEHIVVRYSFKYRMLLMIVGSTYLWTVVGMVVRYCIQYEHYIYQVYIQIPKVLFVRSRELYITLQSVECRIPVAMNWMVYGFL